MEDTSTAMSVFAGANVMFQSLEGRRARGAFYRQLTNDLYQCANRGNPLFSPARRELARQERAHNHPIND